MYSRDCCARWALRTCSCRPVTGSSCSAPLGSDSSTTTASTPPFARRRNTVSSPAGDETVFLRRKKGGVEAVVVDESLPSGAEQEEPVTGLHEHVRSAQRAQQSREYIGRHPGERTVAAQSLVRLNGGYSAVLGN